MLLVVVAVVAVVVTVDVIVVVVSVVVVVATIILRSGLGSTLIERFECNIADAINKFECLHMQQANSSSTLTSLRFNETHNI